MKEAKEHFIPELEDLQKMAALYRLFSDASRLSLLYLLLEQELCVCEITQRMQMNQSAVSNHLKLLRAGRLVKFRREGKHSFYSLTDGHVAAILKQGQEHLAEMADGGERKDEGHEKDL